MTDLPPYPSQQVPDGEEQPLEQAPPPQGAADLAQAAKLERQLVNGANWFYWIAALSAINSIILVAKGGMSFVVGLGITQDIAAIGVKAAREGDPALRYVALGVEIVVAGIFALFGFFARKMHLWAFVVGMLLYALDSLIFVYAEEWWSVGFHVFAFGGLCYGVAAQWKLRKLRSQAFTTSSEPWEPSA